MTSQIRDTVDQPPVLWRQVLGIALVQAAFSLMWVLYRLYLPDLLGQFGFAPQASGLLLRAEEGLAIVCHPLMGNLSDRGVRRVGSQFPLIAVGVILASGWFLLMPILVIVTQGAIAWKSTILFIVVAWSVAMAVVHSPMISLLFKYSAVPQLPWAASCLTLAHRLVGTAAPFVQQSIASLGPLITFGIGSIALLGTATALRKVDVPEMPQESEGDRINPLLPICIGVVGFAIGWLSSLMIGRLSFLLTQLSPSANSGRLMLGVGLGFALLAVPAGWLATRWGNQRTVVASLGGILAVAVGLTLNSSVLGLYAGAITLVIAFSFVFNGVFPFAIAQTAPNKVGLGIGSYLGGLSGSAFVLSFALPDVTLLTPSATLIHVAVAVAGAIAAIGLSNPLSGQQSSS